MADTTETWWQRVQARDAALGDYIAVGSHEQDRRELIRVVEAQHQALRTFVTWADRNDWGCVPKQVEHGMRAALALLDRPAQEVDRGE